MQKKQNKDTNADQKRADKPEADARKDQIKANTYTSKPQIVDDHVKESRDVSMASSEPTSKPDKKRGGKKDHAAAKQGQHFRDKLKAPTIADKDKVVNSSETGFTGDKEGWFDDELYNKPKAAHNFDSAKEHDYYFNSYSSHHIHEEMLKDTSRTLSYQRAIEGNPEDFKGKVVLDIGCGTGILSIFAARAGAKHVYAVDNAEVALFAREIVKKNGFEDKITVFKGKIEEIDFPFGEGGIDIIISEWMGYYLLYESMLDCVLWARDKFLNKKTGKMLPDRAQLYVAAIEDSEYQHEKRSFWDDVYGVDMSCMSTSLFKDPMVDTVPASALMSDACCVLDIDLVNMKQGEVNFSSFYSLKMNHTDKVHALVTWFDTEFGNLKRPVTLTTSPLKKYTHWKQSVFYLEQPLDIRKGDTLYGSVATRQDKVNFRELNVKFSYHIDEKHLQKHFFQQYKFK